MGHGFHRFHQLLLCSKLSPRSQLAISEAGLRKQWGTKVYPFQPSQSQALAGCFEQVYKQMQKTLKHDILQTLGLKSLMEQKHAKTHDLIIYIQCFTTKIKLYIPQIFKILQHITTKPSLHETVLPEPPHQRKPIVRQKIMLKTAIWRTIFLSRAWFHHFISPTSTLNMLRIIIEP